MRTCLRNVRWYSAPQEPTGGNIWLEDGKIAALEVGDHPCQVDAGELDGGGWIVAPGFIDLQLNGGFGYDFTDHPESIWSVGERLPSGGVTGFLPTIITSPLEMAERAMQTLQAGAPKDWRGARPLGLHLEGPFLNPVKKGAHNPQHLRPPDLRRLGDWTRENGVLLVTLAPELPGADALVESLASRGVVVSAGHTLCDFEQAQHAFALGVRCGTHLFNAMPPFDHRTPGLIGALLVTPGVGFSIIVDGIHVHPAMVDLAWRCNRQGFILVTDAMAALGMPPGRYRLGEFAVRVNSLSARLDDGTLAGSILTMDVALRNLMQFTGCTLGEALPALAENQARLLGLENKVRLVPGADADLVLLTPAGEVMMTLVGGEVVYSRASHFAA